jgi:hypothetical protein
VHHHHPMLDEQLSKVVDVAGQREKAVGDAAGLRMEPGVLVHAL